MSLGLWAALWDVVPLIGAVVGALPVALLAAAASPTNGLLILVAFLGYEYFEGAVLQKNSELVARARFDVFGTSSYPDATFSPRVSFGTVRGWRESEKLVPSFTPSATNDRTSARTEVGVRLRCRPRICGMTQKLQG